MAPTTSMDARTEHAVAGFYDALAPDYDLMTGFEKRFLQERPFFHLLIDRYRIGTALDAGCGTGFHSFLLAQLGVNVTALDISQDMLELMGKHARELNVSVRMIHADFHELGTVVVDRVDAVFCMGNTLAHLLTQEELRKALINFRAILKPGGVLFLQTLNYDRIIKARERVQSVKECNGITFVRFYDFDDELVKFNVLRLEKVDGHIEQKLQSIQLRPVLHEELAGLLVETGFADLQPFGGISLGEFQPDTSNNLVMLARRKEHRDPDKGQDQL